MELTVRREPTQPDHTIGRLYINGEPFCWTLEDEYRLTKVYGETRIPAGRYRLQLRKEGGFHQRYQQRFSKFGPDWHQGMLHVTNVPGFEWILIHILNDESETAGCLGVGTDLDPAGMRLQGSEVAYVALYPQVRDALLSGQEVWITYIDDPEDVAVDA